jgi:structural maintenance of chromosome 3 (chondroitin sulfate proteoglycan 6)
MVKEKTGRVTFMPLNRLKIKPTTFPQSTDAQPLIKKLRFDPAHAKAFEQVFGKTCVCKDLTLAASYVRSHGLNTITLDGDKVDRKGALTGGYHDVKRSRIDAIKHVKSWRPKLTELSNRHEEVVVATHRLDQEITQILGKLQVAMARQEALVRNREPLARESISCHREHERLTERAASFETQLAQLEREVLSQRAKRDAFKKELGTPIAQGLTDDEIERTEELGKDIGRLKKSLATLSERKNEVRLSACRVAQPSYLPLSFQSAERRNELEVELNESLRRRREELRGKLEVLDIPSVAQDASSGDLETRRRELESLMSSIVDLNAKISGKP